VLAATFLALSGCPHRAEDAGDGRRRHVVRSGDDWRLTASAVLALAGDPKQVLLLDYEMHERREGRWAKWGERFGMVRADGDVSKPPRFVDVTDTNIKSWPDPSASYRYGPLLRRYLARVAQKAQERTQREIDGHKRTTAYVEQSAEHIEKREAQILAKLRAVLRSRPGLRLNDAEGHADPNSIYPYVVGLSPASARILEILHAEGAIGDIANVLTVLSFRPRICNEYAALIERLIGAAGTGSERRRKLAMLLYAAGYSRAKYHQDVLYLATERDNTWALEAIFFDVGPETGLRIPRVTQENLDLMEKLSAGSCHPEIRLVCAKYALAVQRSALAEQICQELMAQSYTAPDSDVWWAQADSALTRARQNAMYLMFYEIRNERAFKQIFDLAKLPALGRRCMPPPGRPHRGEGAPPGERSPRTIPPRAIVKADGTWAAFSSFPRGRMDVETAQSLISGVAEVWWAGKKLISSGEEWRLTAEQSLYVAGDPSYSLLIDYEMHERAEDGWVRWGGRFGLFTHDEVNRPPKLVALLDQHGQPLPRPVKHDTTAPPKGVE